ncbi:BTB/POZ domain-containing protein At3g56230-like [Corylus avellana]|uniref:BTB/POZ domain-containing protein At3g56230-like n=1 Tax=Corylus avellana TaxID=13451 RepID=UPI00286B5C68|nr:BTB/POZ domain-containing protein At3g56230-like [Corylus avellana]
MLDAKDTKNRLKEEVNGLKEEANGLKEEVSFLGAGFFTALKDQTHTDIQLKPANNGLSMPAHRALLAARSQIFKNMLDSDVCKVPPMDTLTLSEFNYEELECLLEFLYIGSLPKEKVEKHVCSLSLAANKYEISYLQKFCDRHMFRSKNTSNALDFLEISDICSNISLKESILNFIAKNMEDIAFSDRYEEFALKNPHLCVQITRTLVKKAKKK